MFLVSIGPSKRIVPLSSSGLILLVRKVLIEIVESRFINGAPAQVISPVEFTVNDNFVFEDVNNNNADVIIELMFAVAELILLLKYIESLAIRASIVLTANVLACNATKDDFNSGFPFQRSSFVESVLSISP